MQGDTATYNLATQSTDQRPNNSSDHGNKDNPNDSTKNNAGGNGGGGGDVEEGGGNLGPIAVVTPHSRIIRRGGVALSNKPVYWDSPKAAKLFGFNKGEDVYNKLGERVTLLKGAL
jgi:hypothetical protein